MTKSGRFREGFGKIVAAIVLLLLATGGIYKWVDKDGRVHYSDTPPPDQKAQVIETAPAPSVADQQAAAERLKRIEVESAEASNRAAEEAKAQRLAMLSEEAESAAKRTACVNALQQRRVLDVQAPVYRRGAAGERLYITDADRVDERARFDIIIARNCSKDAEARSGELNDSRVLSVGRRADCVELRERIEKLEPSADREDRQKLEALQNLRDAKCPDVSLENIWLAQPIIIRR